MRVRILHAGNYSTFEDPNKRGARHYDAGAVVEFPTEYAQGIVAAGLAKLILKIAVVTEPEVVAEEEPQPGDVEATDAARRLAEEHGLDLGAIDGTGQGGRVTVNDVRRALASE
jgi:pyruvate/2-oxoglutarate dehydrogenase complex dihydrolipoamide acyltransferase (E2) component